MSLLSSQWHIVPEPLPRVDNIFKTSYEKGQCPLI
jgi:hypothetical protein